MTRRRGARASSSLERAWAGVRLPPGEGLADGDVRGQEESERTEHRLSGEEGCPEQQVRHAPVHPPVHGEHVHGHGDEEHGDRLEEVGLLVQLGDDPQQRAHEAQEAEGEHEGEGHGISEQETSKVEALYTGNRILSTQNQSVTLNTSSTEVIPSKAFNNPS